jgi:hypothetical protein
MPNGDIYKGKYKNGMKNGRGILQIYKSNQIYDGYWEDDRFLDSIIY